MLDEWLTEENETLLTAILKIDVKVVLLDAQAMRSKLVLDFLHKSALTRYLRRFDEDIERHLNALVVKQFCRNLKDLAKDLPQLCDALALIDLVPQLIHRAYLDELSKFANDGLPQGVHFDCLCVDIGSLLYVVSILFFLVCRLM